MKNSSASKITLSTYDDLFGKEPELKDCVEIPLRILRLQESSISVNDDEDMAELVASIKDRAY